MQLLMPNFQITINKILQEQLFADVLQDCWCSQRCSQISLENTCARYNVNVKVWLHTFNLHLNLKKAPTYSCFPVSSAGVLSRLFF